MKKLPAVLIGIFVVCMVVLFIHSKTPPREPDTWREIGCAVVKDDRVRENESVRIKLRGPSVIEATVWESECRIPLGTEFQRSGGFVCNAKLSDKNDGGCYPIQSETKESR